MSPWIIDRQPRRKSVREERPVLQLPISAPAAAPRAEDEAEEDPVERGIAVIDFYI